MLQVSMPTYETKATACKPGRLTDSEQPPLLNAAVVAAGSQLLLKCMQAKHVPIGAVASSD
jgi:hypothetical protein